jgi:hypothetical protein
MGNVPLPPWLRRWQQGWLYQAVLVPFVVGFGGFLLADGCLKDGIFSIQMPCLESAFSGFVISLITVFISGKSVGSAEFHADGTPNTTVANVVKVQEAVETGVPGAPEAASKLITSAALAATAVKTP